MPNNALCRKETEVQTISSLEVAEMLGKEHFYILREIEGSKDGKTVGIIPTLLNANFAVSDYFTESTYKDKSGKSNKCYLVTKMGCELLGNKQQGERGIIFTAKYVKRFNDMEQVIYSLDVQQLESSYMLLHERFNAFSETLTEKINKLEAQAEFNHRPSHATKLNWNKVIKNYAKCTADEENIKHIVFARFGISKWEDLTSDKFSDVYGYIRELAEKANMINQVSLFEEDNKKTE